MEMTQTTNSMSSPRFQVTGKELIYKLFDAFFKKTVVEDRTIDFSKPAIVAEDGSIEFVGGEKRFSEIIGVVKAAVRESEVEQPARGRNESVQAYAKRIALWQKLQKKSQVQTMAGDVAPATNAVDVDTYKAALDNYLDGMKTEASEDDSAEPMKVTEAKVMKKIKRKVGDQVEVSIEEKTEKTMTVSKEVKADLDLALAHYNWLWSLGMESVDTSCGDRSKKTVGKERWSKNLVGYSAEDGLWQARVFVKGDLQAIDAATKDLVSKFVATCGDEKKIMNAWKDVLKGVFFGQEYCENKDCLALKEFFSEEEKSKEDSDKSAKQDDTQDSDETKKTREETPVNASKAATKFEKIIAKYVEKKGYDDVLVKFRRKDILLLNAIFRRFMSCPTRPEFKSVEEVKPAFIEFVFKSKKQSDAPIRNGLLHFCNPDRYINMYLHEDKVGYVIRHSDLLRNYSQLNTAELRAQDCLYYSKQFGPKADKVAYQANRTEDKICHIFDRIRVRAAG